MTEPMTAFSALVIALGAAWLGVRAVPRRGTNLPAVPDQGRMDLAAPALRSAPRRRPEGLCPASVVLDVSPWTKPQVRIQCVDGSYSARAHAAQMAAVSATFVELARASRDDLAGEAARLRRIIGSPYQQLTGTQVAQARLQQVDLLLQMRETYGDDCAIELVGLPEHEGAVDEALTASPSAEVIEMVPVRPTSRDGGRQREEPTPLQRLEHQPEDAVDFGVEATALRDAAKTAFEWAKRTKK